MTGRRLRSKFLGDDDNAKLYTLGGSLSTNAAEDTSRGNLATERKVLARRICRNRRRRIAEGSRS